MRRSLILWLALMLVMSSTIVLSQEEEDEPLPPPRRSAAPKIGGAFGFTQNILFLDMDPINSVLRSASAAPFDGNAVLLVGGQGYAYIMFVQNLRIGGMGASGKRTSKSLIGNTRRDVDLSVGFGGVTIDYVVPIVPRLDVTFGALLGGGSMTMKITRDDGTAKVWDNLWDEFGSSRSATEFSRTLEGSFFVYQPTVNVEFALLRWLGLRAGVAYNGMLGDSWELDRKYDLLGVPDNISGQGWMIKGGIFLGTFLF